MQIKAILFTAAGRIATANAVENEDEPDDIASAHATEIHASQAVQEKQNPNDVTRAASAAVWCSVCKEIHYVASFNIFGFLLQYSTHLCVFW